MRLYTLPGRCPDDAIGWMMRSAATPGARSGLHLVFRKSTASGIASGAFPSSRLKTQFGVDNQFVHHIY